MSVSVNEAPISPSWPPPKSPLSPGRLAKLSNALGVAAPLPAGHRSRIRHGAGYSGLHHQSPTPSPSASSFVGSPNTSRFLLHVVPPHRFAYEVDKAGNELTVPSSSASGYHGQFQRGILVPVYSTFQAQLAAIAKEYALPSSSGLVLYLASDGLSPHEEGEPGPRLSEETWRHIWTRVIQAEDEAVPLRSTMPSVYGLGISTEARSTPYLPLQDSATSLRLLTARSQSSLGLPSANSQQSMAYPITPSPSTPSSINLEHKPVAAVRSSSDPQPGEAERPADDTIFARAQSVASLNLPGLHSPSLIPILAKVEFDIDRRKAPWYDPWIRSRRRNHAKRERASESTAVGRSTDTDEVGESCDAPAVASADRQPLIHLKLTSRAQTESPLSFLHIRADGRPTSSLDWSDEDEESAARVVSSQWLGKRVMSVGVQATEERQRHSGATDDEGTAVNGSLEAEDVNDFVNHMQSGMQRDGSLRKKVPPPLVLQSWPSQGKLQRVPSNSSDQDASLAYAQQNYARREGTVFDDDIDLGLDPSEDFGDGDRYDDHRRSQLLMSAKLDEIEKREQTLQQLSPRRLKSDGGMEGLSRSPGASSLTPPTPHGVPVSPGGRAADDGFLSSPRLPQHSDPDLSSLLGRNDESDASCPTAQAWPAVPFSTLKQAAHKIPMESSMPLTPRLAVNGASTSASSPNHYLSQQMESSSRDLSSESQRRRREYEDSQHVQRTTDRAVEGSIIPLSPDPFARFPSADSSARSSAYWENGTPRVSPTPLETVSEDVTEVSASRFSADSILEGSQGKNKSSSRTSIHGGKQANNRMTIMSVKSIKKLWRKSNKGSVSVANPAPPLRSSTTTPSLSDGTPVSSIDEPSPMTSPNLSSSVMSRSTPSVLSRAPSSRSSLQPPRPDRPPDEVMDLPSLAGDHDPMILSPSLERLSPTKLALRRSPSSSSLNSHVLSRPGGSSSTAPPDTQGMRFDQEAQYAGPRKMVHPPTPENIGRTAFEGSSVTITDNQERVVRKSILKFKSTTSLRNAGPYSSHSPSLSQSTSSLSRTAGSSVASTATNDNLTSNSGRNTNTSRDSSSGSSDSRSNDRPLSNTTVRSRRPSVYSIRASLAMVPPQTPTASSPALGDIPPSPHIPDKYLQALGPHSRSDSNAHRRTNSHTLSMHSSNSGRSHRPHSRGDSLAAASVMSERERAMHSRTNSTTLSVLSQRSKSSLSESHPSPPRTHAKTPSMARVIEPSMNQSSDDLSSEFEMVPSNGASLSYPYDMLVR
ncbi:hypothetical protein FISHEDRAFT_60427 [Fistulina hepatica ATCC 64428]|uniref:Uncharacterized protein n=1 Tax=Fistulina hepatica ATCC 64428 TaxID=1128425 RepID=A0A0D7A5M7_9AGAR|nr:hypothetical protein FISHEDRAFT_60427 [Fistulina hepatica ATCC 64428]